MSEKNKPQGKRKFSGLVSRIYNECLREKQKKPNKPIKGKPFYEQATDKINIKNVALPGNQSYAN